MHSYAQITLTSADADAGFTALLNNIMITGATVHYGINKLPVANVHINPTGLKLLCDFDLARRRNVNLLIRTKEGCIRFAGVIDGNSIAQQPGSLTTSLIVKHRFTFLNEVYPRLLGLNSGSMNIFTLPPSVALDDSTPPNSATGVNANGQFYAREQPLYGLGDYGLDYSQKIIPFIVSMFKALVRLQMDYQTVVPTQLYSNSDIENGSSLNEVMRSTQINAQQMGPVVLDLLDSIDTSFTEGFDFTAATAMAGTKLLDDMSTLQDTLFSSLIRMIGQYNCVLVIGNETAYIIPETPYIKVKKVQNLQHQKLSSQLNVALPADYESFTFNDMGENTVKGVYVVHEPMTLELGLDSAGTSVINGYYGQPDASNRVFGNIVVKTLPGIATSYMAYQGWIATKGLRDKINSGDTSANLIGKQVSTEEALNSLEMGSADMQLLHNQVKKYMNDWAQMEYCRIKYQDRTGSITMPFYNAWTPGAPGSVYTRNPGVYVDFYATDIVHNFSISAPDQCNASTTISFNGGRPGASINDGLEIVDMYKYDYNLSQDFCEAFLADIT